MKVIYAEKWKERLDRCEQINKKNNIHKFVLRMFLSLLTISLQAELMCQKWSTYYMTENMKMIYFDFVVNLVVIVFVWSFGSDFIGNVLDSILYCYTEKFIPYFKPIGDITATCSYLIAEKNATILYEDGRIKITHEINDGKKPKKETYVLADIRVVKDATIKEPVLDLQNLQLILPITE